MHSERVSDNAVILAKQFGQDEEKARWAGMLYDIAKEFGDDNRKMRKNGREVDIDEWI